MMRFLSLLLLPLSLFAIQESLQIDLDPSWELVHNTEGERLFKIWEKGSERMILVAIEKDKQKRETIQDGIDQYRQHLPDMELTIHNQTESEALIEWEIPNEAKMLTKLIYTPNASCIIGRSYLGEETESVTINEWITFFNEHVHIDTR